MTVVRLARRWWYLVLPMLLLTAGFALLVAQSVPVTYEATGAILLEPPPGTPAEADSSSSSSGVNRFTDSGSSEVFAARLMETVMANRTVKEELKAKGASDFTVLQGDNTLPLLDVKAESSTAQGALDTLHLVADQINAELLSQQSASTVNQQALITARPLLPTDTADSLYGGRVRAGIGVAALGIAAAFSLPFVMEGISRSRRRQASAWSEQLYAELPQMDAPPEQRPPEQRPPEQRPPARLSDLRD